MSFEKRLSRYGCTPRGMKIVGWIIAGTVVWMIAVWFIPFWISFAIWVAAGVVLFVFTVRSVRQNPGVSPQERRLRALVRAALLHSHGDRKKLLYTMREKWDETALEALGYETYEDFLEAEFERGRVGA